MLQKVIFNGIRNKFNVRGSGVNRPDNDLCCNRGGCCGSHRTGAKKTDSTGFSPADIFAGRNIYNLDSCETGYFTLKK